MRTMMNVEEFYSIHKNNKSLSNAKSNIEMRFVMESFGFKGQRAVAERLLKLKG